MTLVTKQTGPQGRVVQKVLVSRAMEIAREYYLSLTVDGARERVVLIASPAGGHGDRGDGGKRLRRRSTPWRSTRIWA